MILQPFVENSIKHGILPMEEEGNIDVKIEQNEQNELVFGIIDNGIGIQNSIDAKPQTNRGHISKGMQITKGRLNLLKEMTRKNIRVHGPKETKDKNNMTNGTKVEITLPINFNSLTLT
jgi:LytS/YehU family sensor histidine kinase